MKPCQSSRAALAVCVVSLALSACSSTWNNAEPDSSTRQASASSGEAVAIRVNQLGFSPKADKIAIVPATDATRFSVVNENGEEVFAGELSSAATWPYAGEAVQQADFSDLTAQGRFRVRVEGLEPSHAFAIGHEVYRDLNGAAIKGLYFNRASVALPSEYAGDWARAMGHPDDQVVVHESAATTERPAGTVLSAPKGWYDAGDYGKYIVNSGIATYTLLAALEHFPDYYANKDIGIPESGDSVPDLLDETLWNLDWMLKMQDTDGGVYHKLTTLDFQGKIMPEEADATRYMIGKGTTASLNFAAVMATASRVLADYEDQFPGKADEALAAAEAAWQWAKANPEVEFRNPSDVSTGQYGDDTFTDEFAWAAAELFITTGKAEYYQALAPESVGNRVPSWSQSLGLAWTSLAHHLDSLQDEADAEVIRERVISLADEILSAHQESAYKVSMESGDFVWGSNAVAMNRAMMLLQAYRLTDEPDYRTAAQSLLDYVLGRNPTGYSYVTGFGAKPPMHIHHRPSEADGVEAPVPGLLAGGPHSGQQDDCDYPSNKPAKSYVDHWCSYSTNEIAINWNTPLVYVSGALDHLYGN